MANDQNLSDHTLAAIEYEISLLADGTVTQDDFYKVPTGRENARPGSLLKVEQHLDTTLHILLPATALSPIMYQSTNFEGNAIPTSAYILWPYQARTLPDGQYPLVIWTDGTSGLNENAAPSNTKRLISHWMAPYPLALHDYVVVAPDSAGLGVGMRADGKKITHQYAVLQWWVRHVNTHNMAPNTSFRPRIRNIAVQMLWSAHMRA